MPSSTSAPDAPRDQIQRSSPWKEPTDDGQLESASDWIETHVGEIYWAARTGTPGPARLGDLVRAAGDLYPNVLPDRATRQNDQAAPMSDRLRLERDQARFLRALLRTPKLASTALLDMRAPLLGSMALLDEFDATEALDLETVSIRRVGRRAEVTLANTMTLNAETDQLRHDLETAVDVVTLSSSVTVGVLRGAPMEHPSYAGRRVFCAGINLKHLAAGKISYLDFLIGREAGLLAKLSRGVHVPGLPYGAVCPWVCVVDAFAIGGGMQLSLVTDHVVAVDDAYFSLPAAQEGIVPGLASFRLPGRVGPRLARELILFGRRLRGEEAERAGLVDAVVDASSVDAHVSSVADTLSEPAIAANKAMLAPGIESEVEFARYLGDFAVVQAERIHAADVRHKLPRRP